VPDLSPARPTPGAASRLSRRTLVLGVVGGAAGLAVAGCSSDDDTPGKAPETAPSPSPDVAVATSALAEIRAVRVAVTATLARFPENRATLSPLVALHRTHEATLADAVPDGAAPTTSPAAYAVPRKREKALARLTAREQRLHATLDELAVKAQSGQFARLLASMGAALHQRATGSPT
jgi:hypothetical protein